MKDLKSLLYAIPSALAVCLANKDVQKLLGTVPGFDLVKEGSAAIVGAVAPELAGHFICQISFDRIRDQFKHPSKLNHHLERLLKDATVRSVGFIRQLYLEKLQDEQTLTLFQRLGKNPFSETEDILNQLERDLRFWIKDETMETLLLEKPGHALSDITDLLFTYSSLDTETEQWKQLRQFFREKLPVCFNLAFKEALHQDEKAKYAYQLWLLEDIQKQNRQLLENDEKMMNANEQILKEIQILRDEMPGIGDAAFTAFVDDVKEMKELLKANHTEVVGLLKYIIELLLKGTGPHTPVYLTPEPKERHFVGRTEELKDLENLLKSQGALVVVNGLGGMGKTTLAEHFMLLHHKQYKHLVLLKTAGRDGHGTAGGSVLETFVNHTELRDNLHLPIQAGEDPNQVFTQMCSHLRKLPGPNLMLIDNVGTDAADLRDQLPTSQWAILMTSREKPDGFEFYELNQLDEAAAFALFRKHYIKADATDEALRTLFTLFDYHTLMVESTAKVLTSSLGSLSLAQLTERLAAKKLDDDALQEKINTEHGGKERELYTYLILTFSIKGLSAEEVRLLKQLSVLTPVAHSIPELKEWLQVPEEGSRAWKEVLKGLDKKGWLKVEGAMVSIHRLIQDVVLYQSELEWEDVEWLIDSFSKIFNFGEGTNFAQKFPLLPLGIFLAEKVWIFLEKTTTIIFIGHLGICCKEKKDLQSLNRAKFYLSEALKMTLETEGANGENVAASRSNLAMVLRDLGGRKNLLEAKYLLEQALKFKLDSFGERATEVASTRSNLALVLKALGDEDNLKEAKYQLEQALDSDLENYGEKHASVARYRNNLALVLKDLGSEGNLLEAKHHLELALESDLTNFGEKAPLVANRRSNLGLVLCLMGGRENLLKSKYQLELALNSDLESVGSNHPSTAISHVNLGRVLSELGEFKMALEHCQSSYKIFLETRGPDDEFTQIAQSWVEVIQRALEEGNS